MATVSASGHNNGDHFGTAAAPKQDGGTVVMGGAVVAGDPLLTLRAIKILAKLRVNHTVLKF